MLFSVRVPAGLQRADGGHAGGHEPGDPGAPVRARRLLPRAPVPGQQLLLRRRVRRQPQERRRARRLHRLRRGARPPQPLRRLQVQPHLSLRIPAG